MFDKILEFVAPHICCGCGKVGHIICEHCIDDITNESFDRCIVCLNQSGVTNLCHICQGVSPFTDAWAVATRQGVVRRLIDDYKFERAMSADMVCARLLHLRLPQLPPDITVTYVPTISAHIRQRGYDHMYRITREFARRRGLKYASLIKRTEQTVQRGHTKQQRLQQQAHAFEAVADIVGPVLLIDDIYTTGATVGAATRALLEASAPAVYLAIVARQPLDEAPDL